ncbi:MAG: transposase [Planctomycetaceae bacterium]|nr:transposase [Planctomycetaceae bacterium]
MQNPTIDEHRKHCKRYNHPCHAHALTFTCYQGHPFLVHDPVCQKLAESISKACTRHNFSLWAYVFMPEHVHLLVWPRVTGYSISAFLQSVKQPVARWALAFNKEHYPKQFEQMTTGQCSQPYRFWQAGGGYDRNIVDLDTAWKEINYMHRNPVRRKLVEHPAAWFYSSFKDWNTDTQGPIEVDRKTFYVGHPRPSKA